MAVHRLGKKSANGTRSTIVRFINRKNAIYALKNKSKVKHSVYKNLYINENLSPENRNVFNILYKMKKEKYINDVWSANGKINFTFTNSEEEFVKHVYHITGIDFYFQEYEQSFSE